MPPPTSSDTPTSPTLTADGNMGAGGAGGANAPSQGNGNGHDHGPRITLAFENFFYTVPVTNTRGVPANGNGNGGNGHGATSGAALPPPPTEKPSLRQRIHARKETSTKTVLHGLSGEFQPGRLTALNGVALEPHQLRSVIGFVFQDDVILETMTVSEAIDMSLRLRNPPMSDEERQTRLERAIDLLGLADARNTLIGSPLRKGVSGGERKRVAIGMELVARPQVVLLDECTTGLDAFTAYSVMALLKGLAQTQGKTIVCTLHQPSSEIFDIIDDILILVKGEILYHGPAKDMVDYFSARGFDCPRFTNPPDFVFMQVINNNPAGTQVLVEEFKRTKAIAAGNGDDEQFLPTIEPVSPVSPVAHHRRRRHRTFSSGKYNHRRHQEDEATRRALAEMTKYRPSFGQQFRYLSSRSWYNAIRNPLMLQAHLGQVVFLGVLVGLIYLDILGGDEPGSSIAQSVSGALFFVCTNSFFSAVMPVLSVFASERPVFIREYSTGYYGPAAYYWSRTLVELPFQILFPLVFACITYWMILFSGSFVEFLVYTMFIVLLALVGSAFGMCMASTFEDIGISLAVAPVWLVWIQWISPIQYAFTGLMLNFWAGRDVNGFDGDAYLEQLQVTKRFSIGVNVVFMAILYAFYTILGYFALRRIAYAIGGRATPSDRSITALIARAKYRVHRGHDPIIDMAGHEDDVDGAAAATTSAASRGQAGDGMVPPDVVQAGVLQPAMQGWTASTGAE
ncbi:hypothetical protein H9P43_006475 [Blastocladiella emersonii ATCC 22665]|nr:hypothetical protein H9P43_006475 [Blastocladiella emersonii ATCC 22665]